MSSVIITPTQDDLEKIQGFRVSMWRGFKNYECVFCQYATLWMDKMKKHQQDDRHPWAYPGQNPVPAVGTDDEPNYG